MTEEQMTLIKTLIKKHGISATDGEWTLVFLGASYGLTEKQICQLSDSRHIGFACKGMKKCSAFYLG